MNKLELRKKFRAARSALPVKDRVKAAISVAQRFASSPFFKKQHFAAYIAFKDELDLAPLMELLWQAKKAVYLPVLVAKSEQPSLIFSPYSADDALVPNRFGILEPQTNEKARKLEIVLTPLVAFDRHGSRLGTGGGYYDATFKKKHHCQLIGVGFSEQEAKNIPTDPWDIKLDAIITPDELIIPNKK